jgi:RNA polymerase sigma-70 factor (ECF subfamily)
MDDSRPDLVDSETQMLNKARAGDRSALGRLAERFRPRLVLYVIYLKRILGPRIGEADSIVDSAIVKMIARLDQLRGDTARQAFAWVRRIVHNEAHNRAARNVHREALPLDSDGGLADDRMIPAPEQAIKRESEAAVLAAVERLPPKYRKVIQLRCNEDHSFADVGRLTGQSEDSARQQFHRAVKLIRGQLGETS